MFTLRSLQTQDDSKRTSRFFFLSFPLRAFLQSLLFRHHHHHHHHHVHEGLGVSSKHQTAHAETTIKQRKNILLECAILKEDRERLIAAVAKADNWPINKEILIKKHYKAFAKFMKQIDKIKEMN